MADTTVYINGVAEGAFTDALNGLPPWATEDTALNIESLLRKLLGVQTNALSQAVKCCDGNGTGNASGDSLKKANDELDILVKNLKDQNAQSAEKKRKQGATDKDTDRREKKKKATDEVLLKVLTGLVSIGSKVLEVQKQYFITSNELFKSGVNLLNGNEETSSSMLSLNQVVTLTGLRLQTFQEIVLKYTSSINAVGINKFAKTISLTNQKMQQLGYSSAEQAELLGTLVESESSYVDIRNKSSDQLANEAFKLGNQLNKLSLTTGLSNAQLQENIRASAKTNDSVVVAAVYGEEAAKNLQLLAASAKDTDIATMFQKIASAITPELTAPFKALNSAGLGQQATELTRIIQAGRDGAINASQALEQTTAVAKNMNSAQIMALKIQEQAGTEGAAEALTVIGKLRAQGNTLSTATDKQTKSAVENQSAISKFSTELERAKSQMQQAFPLLETQVVMAADKMKLFNDALDTVIGTLGATTRSWIGMGLVIAGATATLAIGMIQFSKLFGIISGGSSVMAGIFGMLRGAVVWVVEGIAALAGPLLAITAAFAAGYGIGTILYNIMSKFSSVNDLFDTIFRGLDHLLQYIPGSIGSDAKERLSFRDRQNSVNVTAPQKVTISIPKSPMQTTIDSPSAVSATTLNKSDDISVAGPHKTDAAVGSGIEKPARNSDINSLLTYQNSISEQVLLSINSLVSVNKDILKYSRINS